MSRDSCAGPWYVFQDEQGMWRVTDGQTVVEEMWKQPRMAEWRALKLNVKERSDLDRAKRN